MLGLSVDDALERFAGRGPVAAALRPISDIGGGPDGGRIVAAGTPEHVARDPGSVTGPWLAEHLGWPGDREDEGLVEHA